MWLSKQAEKGRDDIYSRSIRRHPAGKLAHGPNSLGKGRDREGILVEACANSKDKKCSEMSKSQVWPSQTDAWHTPKEDRSVRQPRVSPVVGDKKRVSDHFLWEMGLSKWSGNQDTVQLGSR